MRIMEIISQDMSLAVSSDIEKTYKNASIIKEPKEIKDYSITEKPYSKYELDYWAQYGITTDTLFRYNVVSINEFKSINKDGNPYLIGDFNLFKIGKT